MNLQHLREHHNELLVFMENSGYAARYVQRFRLAISRILLESNQDRWMSYTDIYMDYEHKSDSKAYLKQMRTVIGGIEQFDLYGRMPDARHRHTLFGRGSYFMLIPEFRELIDFFQGHERQCGRKESSITNVSRNTATFFHHLQNQGATCLKDITETAVQSFFISTDGKAIRSASYKANILSLLKVCLERKEKECNVLISYLPDLKRRRKNIQYLTKDEISAVHSTLNLQAVSLRNKAIITLLLFTGIRSSDIANLSLDAINWKDETITISQQKTGHLLQLPLTPLIGNTIFDYLTQERPHTNCNRLFLSETRPYSPLANNSIENIVAKIFKLAGIRQAPGERKGTHIFRHNVASSMLENGIRHPVISKVLGHSSPDSLHTYLSADFKHLKECALGLEDFPIAKGVL